ncbi:M42 family metallopeptidase [Paludicola sp. MB14-C6]|uniref:M42 family metallopeptidase n=1 Tax=Paludihabitans sp. MB14-C6 TaxID=3070656 RepID=UPI0027DDD669|nr:M42 family metallopeptidase [Paludicola sp. MB14-C6]WMJ24305.1 M42 family metallopeptidase [Paludicola sp. MB14-C6]
MDYTNYIIEKLKKLTAINSPSGFTKEVSEHVVNTLTEMGYSPVLTTKGGVICDLGGKDESSALLMTAHVDTLGGMVKEIKSNGRLRISPIGGLQAQNTEAENCTIVGRFGGTFSGTLQMDSASVHVNKEYSTQDRTFDTMEIVIDEDVKSKEDTQKLGINVGDYVCFDPKTTITPNGYIKSRFLDDKLSVAILLGYAKYLKDEKIIPDRKVYIHITVYEEVGHGGASSIPNCVTEILGVDMGCVGDYLECDEKKVSICAKDSHGPSNYEVTTALIKTAKDNNIDYAVDVYPFYGSDADVALNAGHDIKHCLIGPGVYASHGYERSHKLGVKNTFELIKDYIN